MSCSRLLLVAMASAIAAPAPAQGGASRTRAVDAALAPTMQALRAALADLARADRELMPSEGESTLRSVDDALLERRSVARARVAAGLDSLLAAGANGRMAIRALALDWPGADQVRRAEVRAAFRANDAADALASVTRLAEVAPRDTQLLGWRADALDALKRPADALRARQARFEIAPEDAAAWRAVLAAHEAAGSVPRLRESLGRLRLLHPDSRVVWEREIEILHRLGRREEAAKVSSDSTWRRP